ncbi:hypothetical protein RDI58_028645 [Solanum bulbocastanum]|uniref:Uncharacterized protein n=1 Tax=Solanum bulbocastanum TaxID=147425 RepID=A0AAN8ST60_SOLBU
MGNSNGSVICICRVYKYSEEKKVSSRSNRASHFRTSSFVREKSSPRFTKTSQETWSYYVCAMGLVPTIVVSSADADEKVLRRYDHIFASRPHHQTSQYLSYGQKNLAFAKYGPYWRNMRKLCTVHLLSNHKIHSFQSMRKQEVELLIERIKMEAHHRVAVDLSAKITSLNANLTCLMVFGKKYMDEDFDKRGFKAVVQDAVHLAAMPNLGDSFPFLGVIDLQGFTRKLKDLSPSV